MRPPQNGIIKAVKKFIWLLFFVAFFSLCFKAFAVYDPVSVPNNKIGIHILFPAELKDAAELVNSAGGDWGYVTIPIQSGDKDLDKWQKFMDDCRKFHLIPIVRLATNGDYFNTKVWEKPNLENVLDFANFLDSLNWPTKNRYVVIFNEVNRGDEWGGTTNPSEYAELLSYSVTVFKSKNPDFFIISSAMDNASVNNFPESKNQFAYYWDMEKAVPGIFNQIDGLGSHSYPNPGFSQLPTTLTNKSISSFEFEKNYIRNFTGKKLPTFITETGWTMNKFTDSQIGGFYKLALSNVWNGNDVVAVTPFILKAGTEPFSQFSMKNSDGTSNNVFKAISEISKAKGQPMLSEITNVLGQQTASTNFSIKSFKNTEAEKPVFTNRKNVVAILKWLLRVD
jgi:hypothetical protein